MSRSLRHARIHRRRGRRGSAGFSLIEVMIAVLVLGVGLLGFALMQTMNVRFAQSANQRTQVTNLSYELFDQMRVNRVRALDYEGAYTASTTGAACIPAIGVDLGASDYRAAWECRLAKALGVGATAMVTRSGNEIEVSISWGDERWVDGAPSQVFTTRTEL